MDLEQPPSKEKVCRIVIQQCLNAELKFDTPDIPVSIRRGMVIFTCFLQGAEAKHLDAIVKGVLNVKLCEEEGAGSGTGDSAERESKGDVRDTALKRDVDLLIIPQATLGGKLKGKSIQYHGLVTKSHGEDLFAAFVEKVKGAIQGNKGAKGKVESGVYGARQILKMETNGPFTHVFDF